MLLQQTCFGCSGAAVACSLQETVRVGRALRQDGSNTDLVNMMPALEGRGRPPEPKLTKSLGQTEVQQCNRQEGPKPCFT